MRGFIKISVLREAHEELVEEFTAIWGEQMRATSRQFSAKLGTGSPRLEDLKLVALAQVSQTSEFLISGILDIPYEFTRLRSFLVRKGFRTAFFANNSMTSPLRKSEMIFAIQGPSRGY